VKLIRLATIRLSRPAPNAVSRQQYVSSEGVLVETVSVTASDGRAVETSEAKLPTGLTFAWAFEHSNVRVGVVAHVDVATVEFDDAGRVIVPSKERLRAEAAIQEYADILAVTHQCRRLIRSPQPYVSVLLDPAEEDTGSQPIAIHPPQHERPRARMLGPEVSLESLTGHLADRLDGLALLADSLSEESAAGRVRDLLRLFERAFAKGPHDCVKLLSTFLKGSPHKVGYERAEVAHWLEHLRAELMHADRRPTYARSADVEPFLGRIEWAAYDVLLNKLEWRTRSTDRRSAAAFQAAPRADNSGLVVFEQTATLLIDWMDAFDVYPIDWESSVEVGPPWISLGVRTFENVDADD
jgi:hypothetical protein